MQLAPEIKISTLSYLRQSLEDPIAFRTEIFRKYGDIAWKKTRGKVSFLMGHPIYAEYVLDSHKDNYILKHPFLIETNAPFFGENSVFLSNNFEQWYKDRLIAKMSFEGKVYFKEYADTIVSLCDETLKKWEENYQGVHLFNVKQEIDKLIIDIVLNTIFINFELIKANELADFATKAVKLLRTKLGYFIRPLWFFSPSRKKYEEAVKYFKDLTSQVVRERLKENKEWDDMLGHFIHEYRGLSEEKIIDNLSYHIGTFLIVGYFTTASLLHWIILLLSLYPTVEREVCHELDRVLGSRLPQYEDLSSLPYLSAVVKEVLRLRPPNHAIMRQAVDDDEINGFHIPKHAGVVLSITNIHRHPDFWENPDGFDPHRFIENPLGQDNRFAYIPFGAGPRNCIGSAFSTMEAVLTTAMILQRFRIYLPPFSDVNPHVTTLITNRPKIEMMYIKKRTRSN